MSGYLKLGDIRGESTDAGHVDWINLISIAHYIVRRQPAGAHGATRQRSSVRFGDLTCVKEVDASTPKLQQAVVDGSCFPKVAINLCTSSEGGKRVPFICWELQQVRVTSYSIESTAESLELPTELIALNFEQIKVTYDRLGKDNKSQGKVEYSWKVEEGIK